MAKTVVRMASVIRCRSSGTILKRFGLSSLALVAVDNLSFVSQILTSTAWAASVGAQLGVTSAATRIFHAIHEDAPSAQTAATRASWFSA